MNGHFIPFVTTVGHNNDFMQLGVFCYIFDPPGMFWDSIHSNELLIKLKVKDREPNFNLF